MNGKMGRHRGGVSRPDGFRPPDPALSHVDGRLSRGEVQQASCAAIPALFPLFFTTMTHRPHRTDPQQDAALAEMLVRLAHEEALTPEEAALRLGIPLSEAAWARAVDRWAGLFAGETHRLALLWKRRTALQFMRTVRRWDSTDSITSLRLGGRVAAGTAVPASPVLLTASTRDAKAVHAVLLSLGLDPEPIPANARVPEPGFAAPNTRQSSTLTGYAFDMGEERLLLRVRLPGDAARTALPWSKCFGLPAPTAESSGEFSEEALEKALDETPPEHPFDASRG